MNLFGISWGALSNMWVLLILGGLCVVKLGVYSIMRRWLAQAGLAFGKNKFLLHYSPTRSWIKLGLFCFGAFMIGLAFLQPQWGKKSGIVEQKGRDLFILLDVSRSMLAEDVAPSRLEFAKSKIRQLVNKLGTDRVALIIFAGKPIVQCPLTQDINAFNLFLDQVSYDTVGMGTTALDVALKKVIEQFERVEGRKSRLAVVFTDGEDFSHDLASVRKQAQDSGMYIFAQGLGTEHGAPIPVYNDQGKKTGVLKDEKGDVVITRLNAILLKNLVSQVGGIYVAPTNDQDDIEKIVSKVQRFEKAKFSDKRMSAKKEQYPWFVGISYCCFLLEWLL